MNADLSMPAPSPVSLRGDTRDGAMVCGQGRTPGRAAVLPDGRFYELFFADAEAAAAALDIASAIAASMPACRSQCAASPTMPRKSISHA